MKFFFHAFVLLAVTAASLTAQQIGDTEKSVRDLVGSPAITRDLGERQIWVYPNGGKIVLERGAVVDASGDFSPARSEEEKPNDVVDRSVRTLSQSSVPATKVAGTRSPEKRVFRGLGQNNGYALLFGAIGVLITVVCSITILIEAFCHSVVWGFAVIFLPIAQTIFVLTHWSETRKPFLTMLLLGLPLMFVGFRL